MKLAVLGATGTVGRELVTQALAAGHDVTALVREPLQPDEIDGRVALVVGDAMNVDAVNRLVEGSDAVVSALGHGRSGRDDVLTVAATNMIEAMHAHGVTRLVVLANPVVEDPEDRPGFFYRFVRAALPVVMPAVVRDHRDQARLVEDSDLAWTVVRPALFFTDGAHTGHYDAGAIDPKSGVRISRADLADFMLDTATDGQFVRHAPFVSG